MLACFAAHHAEARVEARLRGQGSVAKFEFITKFFQKKISKVKSFFSKDRKSIEEKFVLTSAGGGSRAFFGFAAFAQGYKKNGIDDLLKDTEFISTNSGSSWFMNRALMEEGMGEDGEEKLDWVKRVHDEMSGYEAREEKINELKDDYAKESTEFKVGKDVYVFKDGTQCLGTIESEKTVENIKKFEQIIAG